tara:strand:+ start:501 stop:1151 length:651 start_codon:yes stop_codon:yes gene_type:complete
MKNELERRNHNEAVGVRVEENGTHILTGYAARFNTLSQNLGGFVEVVDPTAFNQTIGESDVRALFNHDINHVIGRLSANTLRLVVDEVGLKYEIDLPDTAAGRDLAVSVERRDITGSSFGFRAIADQWGETADGFPRRTLLTVALRDIGPVTFPAYLSNDVALRSLAEERNLDHSTLVAAAERNELAAALILPDTEEVAPAAGETNAVPRKRRIRA